MRLLAIIAFVLGVGLSGASAQTGGPLPLVKSFYVKNFDEETMPLAPRLKDLSDKATAMSKTLDSPVSGTDFSWTMGAQDAEDDWEKSVRFAVVKADARQAVVQVKFKLSKRDKPRELHYVLERQGEQWLVADIKYVDQKETLAGLLARGAEGKD